MGKSLKSFAEDLQKDHDLRMLYRSDPIKAMQHYGLVDVSLQEMMDTTEAFIQLSETQEDYLALTKLLQAFAEIM